MRGASTELGWAYYARLSAFCFAVGGAMEAFMNATGFYSKVTDIEAARREEDRARAEAAMERALEKQRRQKRRQL